MSDTATVKGALGAMHWDGDEPAVRFERRFATDPHDLWAAMSDPSRVSRSRFEAANPRPADEGTS